jgi:hypothetical protein
MEAGRELENEREMEAGRPRPAQPRVWARGVLPLRLRK